MRRRSLLIRLTISHTLVTLAGLLLLIGALLLLAQHALRRETEANLATQAQVIAAYAEAVAPDTTTLGAIAPDLARRFALAPGAVVRVIASNGAVLYASRDLGPFPSGAARPLLTNPLPIQPLAADRERLFVARPVVRDGATIGVIELSESRARERQVLALLLLALLPSAALALLGAALAGHLLARSLVRPLDRLRRVATAIASGDLATRSDDRSTDEIGQVAAQLNRMADELNARLAEVERLSAARQAFYRAVSHELRTPLTAIRGTAENLEDDATPAQRAALQVIQSEALRLQRLVDELLSPRESSPAPLRRRQPVAIDVLIEDVQRIMQPRAARSGVALTHTTTRGIWVNGDRDRLKQALLNLLDNALIWTPPGGSVHIAATGDDSTARIIVRDTGPGIPPELSARVWERGVSTSGGQGLGLALVRDVVTAHGGSAELLDGVGTAIELRLPAVALKDGS